MYRRNGSDGRSLTGGDFSRTNARDADDENWSIITEVVSNLLRIDYRREAPGNSPS